MAKLRDEDIFEHLQFKDGKTYQVRIEEIEKLSGLKFDWSKVVRPFKDKVPKVLSGVVNRSKKFVSKSRIYSVKNRVQGVKSQVQDVPENRMKIKVRGLVLS